MPNLLKYLLSRDPRQPFACLMKSSSTFRKILLAFAALCLAALLDYFTLNIILKSPPATSPTQRPGSILGSSKNSTDSASIRIGVILPLTGSNSAKAEHIKNGLAMAVSDIAELAPNKKFQLLTRDSGSTADTAAAAASDLIKNEGVSLILSAAGEDANILLALLANKAKVPLIYTGDGPPKTCLPDNPNKKSPYVWGTGATSVMKLEPLLIYLSEMHSSESPVMSLYIFGTQTEESSIRSKEIISAADSLGFKTVGEIYVDPRESDFFQRIRRIFYARPDVLFVTTDPPVTAPFYQQAAKMSVSSDMTLVSLDSIEEKFSSLGKALNGLRTVARYSPELDNAQNRKFKALWRKKHSAEGSKPSELAAASAYGSLMIAAKAFKKAKSASAGDFAEAMKELQVDLPQGKVIVSGGNNLLIQPLYSVVVFNKAYSKPKYLGDLSHPGLERCVFAQLEDGESIDE